MIESLALEYLEVIDMIRYGEGDIHKLEAQRGVLHEQLCSLLNKSHSSKTDMVTIARDIVWRAKLEGRL